MSLNCRNSKRAPSRKTGCSLRVNPAPGVSGINAVAPAKKEVISMPDIRRMGDDFVIVLNGEVARFESYDAAYGAWEESR